MEATGDGSTLQPTLIVVMGVSASGKSTVGELLAARLGLPYADADEFHPPENIAKMSAGEPLTDDDRRPWLEGLGRWLAEHQARGGVATCSALKRRYRDVLTSHAPGVTFLYLRGDEATFAERMQGRKGHFMPMSLLRSQLETLEAPSQDERAVAVDAGLSPPAIVEDFLRRWQRA